MLDCARFCVFAWFDPVTSFCGAVVAQLSKKRHTVAASLRETCHEQQTKPRHLSLCSNTPPPPPRNLAHSSIPAPFQSVKPANGGLLRQSVASRGSLLPSVAFRGLANSFAIAALWCYMYTPPRRKSMENRYRRSLEKLAAEPPTTKTALVCALLPEIETALVSG